MVKSQLAASALYQGGGEPSFHTIFKFVQDFLKRLSDDLDPYKSAKPGATDKPLVATQATTKTNKQTCDICGVNMRDEN